MDQTQTTRFASRFEHPALRPRLHTEGFPLNLSTKDSHTGNLHRGFGATTTGSTQLLSQLQTPPLHLEGWAISQTMINLSQKGYQQTQSTLLLEG